MQCSYKHKEKEKQKLRKIEYLAQGHKAKKRQSQDLNSD